MPQTRLLAIHFIYKDSRIPDDILTVNSTDPSDIQTEPMFTVNFSTTTVGRRPITYRSYFNRGRMENYIQSLLMSMRVDHDPFEFLQVTSSMFPSFMYEVRDLSWEVRDTIMNVVNTTLTSNVTRVHS